MKNKKVGIITLYGNNNYGNKLQNYAMQQTLKKLGYDVETIENRTWRNINDVKGNFEIYGFSAGLKVFIKNILKTTGIVKLIKKRNRSKEDIDLEKERIKNIKEFDKLIKTNPIRPYNKNLKKIDETYDLFVMGSDQIWNPNFLLNYKFELGLFTSSNKKMSYAASLAVSDMNDDMKKIYKKVMNDMLKGTISAREYEGEKLLEDLTEKDVVTVLDPTMLLDKKEWEELIKEPKVKPSEKFLLTYILGDTSKRRKNFVNEVAKKYDLDVINLLDFTQPEVYSAGVGEFLWYFKNADIIFADSFHAGVFSILFEKPFYILNRTGKTVNMNSRFDTLLSTFDIKDRFLPEYDISLINKDIDYNYVNEKLKIRKEESMCFLKNSLEILKNN